MCVDILRANLKDKNKFPLNMVDLDTKIEGTTTEMHEIRNTEMHGYTESI